MDQPRPERAQVRITDMLDKGRAPHVETEPRFWSITETIIYLAVSGVIVITAFIALSNCGLTVWHGLHSWNLRSTVIGNIDGLLLVLMLVEILHTVRISVHSHVLVAEPFLMVGLIATIRRILVIGLEAGNLSRPETWNEQSQTLFRASILELGLLGLLVMIFVAAIYVLRRSRAPAEES